MTNYISKTDFMHWHPIYSMASNNMIMLDVELNFLEESYTYIVHRYSEIFIKTTHLDEAIKVFNERVRMMQAEEET